MLSVGQKLSLQIFAVTFCLLFLTQNVNAVMVMSEATTADPNSIGAGDIFYKGGRRFKHFHHLKFGSATITSIAQGIDDVLWFAHQNGIVKYDGIQFHAYRHDPNKNSVPAGYVMKIIVAQDGRIWIATRDNGLSVLDPKTEIFYHYRHDPNSKDSLSNDRVMGLAEDEKGNIWIGSHGGLSVLNPGDGSFQHYSHDPNNPNSISSNYVRILQFDAQQRLWIGTDNGLNLLRRDSYSFSTIGSDKDQPDSFFNQQIYAFEIDDRGRLWIGTQKHGAAWLNLSDFEITRLEQKTENSLGVSGKWITDIAVVDKNQIWLSTFGNGITVLDAKTGDVIDIINHDANIQSTLSTQLIFQLFKDNSGMLWVGTWGQKMSFYLPNENGIRLLQHSADNDSSISTNNIINILELRSGQFLLASLEKSTIDLFDPVRGKIRTFSPENGFHLPGSPAYMLELSDETIIIGVLGQGIYRIWLDENIVEHIPVADGNNNNRISPYSMLIEPDDTVWIGVESGLMQWSPRNNILKPFPALSDDGSPFSMTVKNLARNNDGSMWLATGDGLYKLSAEKSVLTRVESKNNESNEIVGSSIDYLAIDNDDNLTFSSNEYGLYKLLGKDVKSVDIQLIKSGEIPFFILDNSDDVWTYGNRMTKDGQSSNFLTDYPGINGSNWNRAAYKTSTGTIMFGGVSGVTMIRPELYSPWQHQPNIISRAVKVDGKKHILGENNELILPPETRSFSLEFAALDFSGPEQLKYHYKLHGYNLQWQEAATINPIASYTNLPPGKYAFEVKATNREDEWSQKTLSINIIQQAAWHQTWLFKAIIIFFVFGMFYLFFQIRVRRLEKQKQNLDRIVETKTKELQEKNKQLEEISLTDQLTGAKNRRFFSEFITQELKQLDRNLTTTPEKRLCVLLLDIDHFKKINDNYGHGAGDEVLIQFTQILHSCIRENDWVIRWGGEEFLILCHGSSMNEFDALADRIINSVSAHDFAILGSQIIKNTCSAGLATYPFLSENTDSLSAKIFSIEETIELADAALYMAKENGRNLRVSIGSSDITHKINTKQQILKSPKEAITQGTIKVTFSR